MTCHLLRREFSLFRVDPLIAKSPPHLLVVEDNDLNYELFEVILELRGFRLSRARSGREAYELVSADPPDLVIMDVGLPDVDGIDLVARIRQDRANAELPFVCVSGHATAEDKERAASAGVVRYLTKPINTRSFAQEIEEILGEVRPGDAHGDNSDGWSTSPGVGKRRDIP